MADFREMHSYLCVHIMSQSESQAQAAKKGTERAISRDNSSKNTMSPTAEILTIVRALSMKRLP
jgi:hypothetical protein